MEINGDENEENGSEGDERNAENDNTSMCSTEEEILKTI